MMRTRTLSVSLAGMALFGLGASVAAPAAQATSFGVQAVAGVKAAPANPAVIDPAAETTLNINKYLGAPVAGASNGEQVNDITLPPLSGVKFDVYQVGGVDLTTNAGWAAATALQSHTITQAEITAGELTVGGTTYALTKANTVTTGTDGTATFDGKVGLYLVAENVKTSTEIRNTATDTVVPNAEVTPSAPFLVTLPMTSPTELNTWNYDVYAYPKNAQDTVRKTVIDEGTLIGSLGADKKAYSYTIETSVTPGLTAGQIKTYVVGDKLDSRVSLTGVTLATKSGTPLVAGDYTVYVNDEVWTAGTPAAGAKVEVVLTEAGLAKVVTGGGLNTKLSVTADSTGTDGIILNKATFIPNNDWWTSNTGQNDPYNPASDDPTGDVDNPVTPPTSNEVRTLFGSLNVTKTDAKGGAALDGVTFQVWLDGDADGECTDDDYASPYTKMYEGVTNAEGKLTFSGLQTSNFYDGTAQTEEKGYCLLESKAKEGYNLLAEDVYFTIDAAGDEDTGLFAPKDTDLALTNVKSNIGNSLPLTGGAGAAGLGVGALLLLGGAGLYAAKRRRDERDDEDTLSEM